MIVVRHKVTLTNPYFLKRIITHFIVGICDFQSLGGTNFFTELCEGVLNLLEGGCVDARGNINICTKGVGSENVFDLSDQFVDASNELVSIGHLGIHGIFLRALRGTRRGGIRGGCRGDTLIRILLNSHSNRVTSLQATETANWFAIR